MFCSCLPNFVYFDLSRLHLTHQVGKKIVGPDLLGNDVNITHIIADTYLSDTGAAVCICCYVVIFDKQPIQKSYFLQSVALKLNTVLLSSC